MATKKIIFAVLIFIMIRLSCRLSGYFDTDDNGDTFNIGGTGTQGGCEHNLIENNHIYHGAHSLFKPLDRYNVIRDNYQNGPFRKD